jgi:hypothetical protein
MEAFVVKILNALFGCSHPDEHITSLPFTDAHGVSYKTCTKCGTKLLYDKAKFRFVTPQDISRQKKEAKRRVAKPQEIQHADIGNSRHAVV